MVVGFPCVSKKEVEGSDSLMRLNDCLGVLLPGLSILGCRSQAQGLLIARDGSARIAQIGHRRRTLEVANSEISLGELEQQAGIVPRS